MVISSQATLALYCQQCGNLTMYDLSRFTLKKELPKRLICSCGHCQATIVSAGLRQCLLSIPCVICNIDHLITLDSQRFWRDSVEKVYCTEENLELGFVGRRPMIEAMIAAHKKELDTLFLENSYQDCEEDVVNSQVMLEVINLIHDIAERGGVYCRCGGTIIETDILADRVEIICDHCGGRQVIPALTDSDVTRLKMNDAIEIVPIRQFRRKH
ncbi:hypothetical protein Ga0466249_001802 [Sporomusaceae bacterium BoRhaA]|uniref:hypothetical protein n=1 Tax=Pelorhabdus rhamnosifermentans TaxID=2772457 RepID=UPI001C062CA1|nr:hypothetical protein [Pelorhabdus rhamnosifermentans]MBU2700697.1 hypothetical protein [Pelorhabdus rhamnosifermentans]